MPIISIVLPTFNRGYVLKKSISSVLNQTCQDFELIIVDDCSVDNTFEVISSFASKKIVYVKLNKNFGSNYARNVGIKMSKGEYIAFQDSDDVWCLDKLERQLHAIKNSNRSVGVVYSPYRKIFKGAEICIPEKNLSRKSGYVLNEMLKGNFVGTPTALVKKECFRLAGIFDSDLPRLQDWDFFIRVSMYYQFILIEEPLVTAYSYGDNISSNPKAYINAMDLIIKRYLFLFKKNKKILSNHHLFRFIHEAENLNIFNKQYLYKAISINPLNIRAMILLIFRFNFVKKVAFFLKFLRNLI